MLSIWDAHVPDTEDWESGRVLLTKGDDTTSRVTRHVGDASCGKGDPAGKLIVGIWMEDMDVAIDGTEKDGWLAEVGS